MPLLFPTFMNRRKFVKTSALAAAGLAVSSPAAFASLNSVKPMKRTLGKLGFDVTTLGLGGQASLQWTPEGVDPVKIILKAFNLGINYFDTSNLYGPSQSNYGKAFKIKKLIPGTLGYNDKLRKSIFLTTKTHLRWAKGDDNVEGIKNWTNGTPGSHTIDDVRRSLSLMFGDGKGKYPKGAYLDMVLIHNLNTLQEVDALYTGLYNTDPNAERIGALAALRDYRDGTNLTGLNPKAEKLIRHIGFSGHYDPSVMMYMIRRDYTDLLDAMLVAVNANDKLMFNMQYNVIPLAKAKNMGIIGMKVFADGAMYTKPAEWSQKPEHVVRTLGDPSLPSASLVKYSLTTPGVDTVIIGIGQISDKPDECQLTQNLVAAQILRNGLTNERREAIETMAAKAKNGKTNYFQIETRSLTSPDDVSVDHAMENNVRKVFVNWHTSYAGDAPIVRYEVWRDGRNVGEIAFMPQISMLPISFSEVLTDMNRHTYSVRAMDGKGRIAESESMILPEMN